MMGVNWLHSGKMESRTAEPAFPLYLLSEPGGLTVKDAESAKVFVGLFF